MLVVSIVWWENGQLFCHVALHIAGVQIRILSLFFGGADDRQKLHLNPIDGLGQEQPDGKEVGVALLEGPCDGIQLVVAIVAKQNRLDGNARAEGATFELNQLFAVGVGALGEDEDLGKVVLVIGPIKYCLGRGSSGFRASSGKPKGSLTL